MNAKKLINNIRLFSLFRREQRISRSFDLLGRNFLRAEQFQERMIIEKRRAERMDYSTSMIVFNIIKSANNSYSDFEDRTYKLLKIICSKIRMTDLVCLYDNNRILMLLPDTMYHGAQNLCERLMREISKKFYQKDFINNNLEIEILSYPQKANEQPISRRKRTNKARVIPMPSMAESTSTLKSTRSQVFRMNYVENLNMSVGVYNGSSIALPIDDVFFWDQELFSKFFLNVQRGIKRTIDIVGSAIGLVLLSPVIMLISLLVKITSSGPIFFKQERVGHRGRHFTFLKFRSMSTNCENNIHQDYMKKLIQGEQQEINNGDEKNPMFKMKDDPRITPLGRFLRKTSLDELPQLWNVFKGEMSLVGPRPPIPYEVKEYRTWHRRRVLEVKPGITGLWQVSGRNKTTFDEMVRLDIFYAQNWCLKMDLEILLKTFKAIFVAEGT